MKATTTKHKNKNKYKPTNNKQQQHIKTTEKETHTKP